MKDGSIVEMQVTPKRIRFDDGRAFDLKAMGKLGDKRVLSGENNDSSITIEIDGSDVLPGSVQGAVIEFHDPIDCIGKWQQSAQSNVIAVTRRC